MTRPTHYFLSENTHNLKRKFRLAQSAYAFDFLVPPDFLTFAAFFFAADLPASFSFARAISGNRKLKRL
jgi:hypothetical protein